MLFYINVTLGNIWTSFLSQHHVSWFNSSTQISVSAPQDPLKEYPKALDLSNLFPHVSYHWMQPRFLLGLRQSSLKEHLQARDLSQMLTLDSHPQKHACARMEHFEKPSRSESLVYAGDGVFCHTVEHIHCSDSVVFLVFAVLVAVV